MERRNCSKCSKSKIYPDEFHRRNDRDYVYRYCKECHRNKMREHYQTNKQYYVDKAKRNNAKTKIVSYDKVFAYLEQHPCVDCGEDDIVVLQFDHVTGKKFRSISQLISKGFSFDNIENEIAKCVVRCSNCHIRKTAVQLGWYRASKLNGPIVQLERAQVYET